MRKMTTEQVVENSWDPWKPGDDGRWSFDAIKTCSLLVIARYSKKIYVELRSLNNSMRDIKHYFHGLDRDGFREIIKIESGKRTKAYNALIIRSVGCGFCSARKGQPCTKVNGQITKLHAIRRSGAEMVP